MNNTVDDEPPSGRSAEPHEASGEDIVNQVYDQLCSLAQQQMSRERNGHTLSATALVHEAYLRLSRARRVPWRNRGHYYAAAAEAMRHVLVDHARAKNARGGPPTPMSEVPEGLVADSEDPAKILAVDAALRRLEGEDPEAAAVVRLRFFAGLSVDQAAEALGISPRSAARLWSFARASLHRTLGDDHREES